MSLLYFFSPPSWRLCTSASPHSRFFTNDVFYVFFPRKRPRFQVLSQLAVCPVPLPCKVLFFWLHKGFGSFLLQQQEVLRNVHFSVVCRVNLPFFFFLHPFPPFRIGGRWVPPFSGFRFCTSPFCGSCGVFCPRVGFCYPFFLRPVLLV